MNIVVLMTCFNRREKTEKSIISLVEGNANIQLHFVIVDDGSDDGTVAMLEKMGQEYSIDIIIGDGGLYYSGGMRKAMSYVLGNKERYDYVLLANDDVEFFKGSIEGLLEESINKYNSIIVGVTCNEKGEYTYGAIKYDRGIKYHGVGIECSDLQCDTFNANCVIIPWKAFSETGVMDSHYIHSLGDFDYGMALKRNSHYIYPSTRYVGICCKNESKGTWEDKKLSRRERIKKKEQVKGAPWKPWFYYLKKNFGLSHALIYSVTPYFRIMMKK